MKVIWGFGIGLVILLALAVFMAFMPTRVLALTIPCALDPNNRIVNGSMIAAEPDQGVAANWHSFIINGAPIFEHTILEDYERNGSGSQYIWQDRYPFDAGIYQTVTGLTPGAYYHTWLGFALAAYDPGDQVNHRNNLIGRQIGVDPAGGTDPLAPTILWSHVIYDGKPANDLAELNLTFAAQAANATIFLRGINTYYLYPIGRMKLWFDSACMEAVPAPTSPMKLPSVRALAPVAPAGTLTFLPLVGKPLCVPASVVVVNVGWHPKGVAVDPTTNRVSVSLFDATSATFVDANTNATLATWWLNDTGNGNGIGATNGRVVVSVRETSRVAIRNGVTGQAVGNPLVGTLPFGVGAANGRAWIANYASGSVSVFDPALPQVITTTNVGGAPSLIAATDQRAFVSTGGGVAEITRDGTLTHNLNSLGSLIFGVAFNSATNQLYVSDRNTNQVMRIDPATGVILQRVTLPQTPYALAINPVTQHLFVVFADVNQLDVLDSNTFDLVGTLPLGVQGADGGDGIAVLNGNVYIANYADGTISVIKDCP